MPYPDDLQRMHRKLERFIKSEIRNYQNSSNKEIYKYKKDFERDLKRTIKESSHKELAGAMLKSKCVLIGDFHTFSQSQKTYMRLLKMYLSMKKKPLPVIALECVNSDRQSAVDQFLSHLISVEELKEALTFDESWPFPWENYRPIFEFAREEKIKVLGINKGAKSLTSTLIERDKHAASVITNWLREKKSSLIFVLIGDFHLSKNHLPLRISENNAIKSSEILSIHQNNPALFWLQRKRNIHSDLVRISANEFCVLNAVPWIQLKTYLDWLEGNPANEDENDGIDIPGSVSQFSRLIKEALKIPGRNVEEKDFILPEQVHRKPPLRTLKLRHPKEIIAINFAAKFKRSVVFNSGKSILIPFTSTNTLADAAALAAWSQQFHPSRPMDWTDSSSLVLHFYVSYLGSKQINPKRKCNELVDLKKISKSNRVSSRRKKIFSAAYKMAASFLRNAHLPKINGLTAIELVEATRLVGYLLGERIFILSQINKKAAELAPKAFSLPYTNKKWKEILLKQISLLASSRELKPVAKADKL